MQTPSNMLSLGTCAPDFLLPDPSGQLFDLKGVAGEVGVLVCFICNHCPYVIHVLSELVKIAHEAMEQGVGVVAISANDADAYPADAPSHMQHLASDYGFHFPYLYDESQSVAIAYQAACTPDFFLFNAKQELVYRGQFDGSRPGKQQPVTGRDLKAALAALVDGMQPLDRQLPSVGCNIKWKSDRVPDYFPPSSAG